MVLLWSSLPHFIMSSFRFLFMDDAILVGQPQEQLCLGKADRPISPLAYLASLTVKLSNDASFWGQTQDRQSTLMLMNLPIFDRFKPKVMGQRGNVQIWPIHLPKAKTGKTKHSILRNTNRQTCQPPEQYRQCSAMKILYISQWKMFTSADVWCAMDVYIDDEDDSVTMKQT